MVAVVFTKSVLHFPAMVYSAGEEPSQNTSSYISPAHACLSHEICL